MDHPTPETLPDLSRDDDDVGEFLLPTFDPAAMVPDGGEREQYDEQILAGLVSP